MAKWLESKYGSHYLKLDGGLECSISWSTKRNDEFPYRVRVFGNDIGGAKTLEAAKLNTEKLAADILTNALKKLQAEPVSAGDKR